MLCLKITFSTHDVIATRFNGIEDEARVFYAIGKEMNIGNVEDNIQTIVKLEIEEETVR